MSLSKKPNTECKICKFNYYTVNTNKIAICNRCNKYKEQIKTKIKCLENKLEPFNKVERYHFEKNLQTCCYNFWCVPIPAPCWFFICH